MATTLFISDLHLCGSRPETTRAFFDFLRGPARGAQALYVLGDLFEYWAGDDDVDADFNAATAAALSGCAAGGTQIFVMHGNRDFLLGPGFARASRVELIPDPVAITLCGAPTLLTHGDTLCTDDREYQAFRTMVRSADWKEQFLAVPLADRKEQIAALRARSEVEKHRKPPQIMDVNPQAVEALLRANGYPRLIHGHTHLPARHEHTVDGRSCERWVLPDWYLTGGVLVADDSGLRLESVA